MASVHIEVGSAVKAASPRVRAIQKAGERILRAQLGDLDGLRFIDNRVRRDGDDPHITILSPQEHKTAITTGVLTRELLGTVAIPDDFRVMGLGRALGGGSTTYFVVLNWPGGEAFRASLGFDPGGPGGSTSPWDSTTRAMSTGCPRPRCGRPHRCGPPSSGSPTPAPTSKLGCCHSSSRRRPSYSSTTPGSTFHPLARATLNVLFPSWMLYFPPPSSFRERGFRRSPSPL